MGLAWLQRQPRTGKSCTDEQMVSELNTRMGFPSPRNRKPIPWPTDQSGEASAISSDIGTRVRSCVAEQRSPPRSQGRASSWTQMDSCAESPVPGSRPVCLRSWSHALSHICMPAFRIVQGACWADCGADRPWTGNPTFVSKYFFDGWRVHPTLPIPSNLPRTKEAPVRDITPATPSAGTEPTRSPEEEARDILATAAKNQAEDGPNTRRAAVRACKYLRAMVNQYESTIQEVHKAARIHAQMSKGTAGSTADYRPQGGALPVISPELTSELLHCLSTLPDPWPLAKITIDMEKPSQWVSKLCRLYFADEYARRTVGVPRQHTSRHRDSTPGGPENPPKLDARMIEFLAEWLVTFLIPAMHVFEVRAPHLFLCSSRNTEEARTCEAWFQLTFRPQKWNLKAHMWWYQLSPFPSSNVAICDAAPPRQHSPILRYSALLRYSVLCFNSSAQCNWHDIETMAE